LGCFHLTRSRHHGLGRARAHYWQKYGSDTNREAWNKWQSVARAFHGMGVLLRRGLVDIDLVEELLANIARAIVFRVIVTLFHSNR
jgi:hypothetical protein